MDTKALEISNACHKSAIDFAKLVQIFADHPLVTPYYRVYDPYGDILGEFKTWDEIGNTGVTKSGELFDIKFEYVKQVFVIG